MKKILLFIVLVLNSYVVNSQSLSKEQAIDFAEKLNEVQILSEKGRDALVKMINNNELRRSKKPSLMDGSITTTSALSHAQILYFLNQAFYNDLHFRSGLVEWSNLEENLRRKEESSFSSEKSTAEIEPSDSLFQTFEGPKIELAIEAEDSVDETSIGFMVLPMGYGSMEDFNYIHPKTSVIGKTRNSTLQKLVSIGLIDSALLTNVKMLIGEKEIVRETVLMDYLAGEVAFQEDLEENKGDELEFLTRLKANKIISKENFLTLTKPENANKLFAKYELIPYCNKALDFNVKDYTVDPVMGYEEIFEEIKVLIPDFNFKNLKVEIIEEEREWDNSVEQSCKITFEVSDIQYSNIFFYGYIDKEEKNNDKDTLMRVSNHFCTGINKFLSDQNSEYRLFFANYPGRRSVYGEQKFGLILLTEKQFQVWGTSNSDFFLFGQSFDTRFNTQGIKKIIADYEKIGLFKHLTKEEIDNAKECIFTSDINSYQDILLCYPKTLAYLYWELGEIESPYKEFIESLREVSGGAFNPQNIVDEYEVNSEKETMVFSFELNGKNYQENFQMQSRLIDTKFLDLIRKALKENGIDREIYYCHYDGGSAGYLFLSKYQHKYLEKNQKELFSEW